MKKDDRDDQTGSVNLNGSRRTFLKGLIASGAGAVGGSLLRPNPGMASASAAIQKNRKSVVEEQKKVPVVEDVDVLVVGGGMAGVGAAVAAGRAGLKTLVVEYFGCLGGNGTSGMVNNFCGYTTSGPNKVQIVQGIGGEIHKMLFQRNGVSSMKSYTFNPEILKIVLDEEAAEANVKLLYYTQVVDSIMENNVVKGVFIENKAGRQAILARMILDCSGDGDVCAWAGVPLELGDGAGGFLACDMAFHIVNVGSNFNPSTVNPAAAEAMKSGEYKITRPQAIIQNIMIPGAYWVNWAGVPREVNGIDPYKLSQAAVEGRKVVRELRRFLRDKIAGMENAEVVDTAPKMGLRETRRVMGGHLLTGEEVLAGTKFKDGIGACAWPIEIVDPVKGRKFEFLKDGDFYTIPYRCLVPQKVENLLMAGRFVSCNHQAQASARVMGPAVVMGQAIGTAAALSIKKGVSPRNLDVSLLQQELVKAGAFLG